MPHTIFPGLSAEDWLSALEIHLRYQHGEKSEEQQSSSESIIAWLKQFDELEKVLISSSNLSKVKKLGTIVPKERNKEEKILKVIQDNIPVTPILKHLANLRYRSLGFYDPRRGHKREELQGIYIARRFSFAFPGLINISAFRFQRDRRGRPFYKEKRVIDSSHLMLKPTKQYQIRTRGSWFADRDGYSLIGMSYEFEFGAKEANTKSTDIVNIFDDRIFFHNDHDPKTLRGLITTITKDDHTPAVTEIELSRLDVSEHIEAKVWGDLEMVDVIPGTLDEKIGLRQPKNNEEQELGLREHDPNYKMPLIKTRG